MRDEGISIPQAQQGRIFSRFERAENARALDIGGTGPGLYLSRELFTQHGGRSWFESSEGNGTTFHIALPVVADEDTRAEPDGTSSSQEAGSAREPVRNATPIESGS